MINNVNFHELPNMKYWQPPQSWATDKKRETIKNRIFSGEWLGAHKKDGAFFKFIKNDDGTMELLGRSKGVGGDYLNKIEWVPHLMPFFESLPNGTCLLGELYLKNSEGSRYTTTIIGCLKEKAIERQKKEEPLTYYIFDCLAYAGENLVKTKASERFDIVTSINTTDYDNAETAKYYRGTELWEQLSAILANGEEGIVMTHEDAVYEPDKRPSKTTMKVKKEISQTIDCFFTGRFTKPTEDYTGGEIETWPYWYDDKAVKRIFGTFYKDYVAGAPIRPITKSFYLKMAGSMEIAVMDGGKIIPIGYLSGLTEEIKSNPKDYAFKCIEVSAMELQETGGIHTLRHAKMVQFRPDKTPADCGIEQVK